MNNLIDLICCHHIRGGKPVEDIRVSSTTFTPQAEDGDFARAIFALVPYDLSTINERRIFNSTILSAENVKSYFCGFIIPKKTIYSFPSVEIGTDSHPDFVILGISGSKPYYYAFTSILRGFLSVFDRTVAGSSNDNLKEFAISVIKHAIVPDPGHYLTLSVHGISETLAYFFTPALQSPPVPIEAITLRFLFETLKVNTIVGAWEAMLTCRVVVFHGSSDIVGYIPLIIEALSSLLYPLKWESNIIPCLSSDLIADLIEAPGSPIIYCDNTVFSSLDSSEKASIVSVDVDSGNISLPNSGKNDKTNDEFLSPSKRKRYEGPDKVHPIPRASILRLMEALSTIGITPNKDIAISRFSNLLYASVRHSSSKEGQSSALISAKASYWLLRTHDIRNEHIELKKSCRSFSSAYLSDLVSFSIDSRNPSYIDPDFLTTGPMKLMSAFKKKKKTISDLSRLMDGKSQYLERSHYVLEHFKEFAVYPVKKAFLDCILSVLSGYRSFIALDEGSTKQASSPPTMKDDQFTSPSLGRKRGRVEFDVDDNTLRSGSPRVNILSPKKDSTPSKRKNDISSPLSPLTITRAGKQFFASKDSNTEGKVAMKNVYKFNVEKLLESLSDPDDKLFAKSIVVDNQNFAQFFDLVTYLIDCHDVDLASSASTNISHDFEITSRTYFNVDDNDILNDSNYSPPASCLISVPLSATSDYNMNHHWMVFLDATIVEMTSGETDFFDTPSVSRIAVLNERGGTDFSFFPVLALVCPCNLDIADADDEPFSPGERMTKALSFENSTLTAAVPQSSCEKEPDNEIAIEDDTLSDYCDIDIFAPPSPISINSQNPCDKPNSARVSGLISFQYICQKALAHLRGRILMRKQKELLTISDSALVSPVSAHKQREEGISSAKLGEYTNDNEDDDDGDITNASSKSFQFATKTSAVPIPFSSPATVAAAAGSAIDLGDLEVTTVEDHGSPLSEAEETPSVNTNLKSSQESVQLSSKSSAEGGFFQRFFSPTPQSKQQAHSAAAFTNGNDVERGNDNFNSSTVITYQTPSRSIYGRSSSIRNKIFGSDSQQASIAPLKGTDIQNQNTENSDPQLFSARRLPPIPSTKKKNLLRDIHDLEGDYGLLSMESTNVYSPALIDSLRFPANVRRSDSVGSKLACTSSVDIGIPTVPLPAIVDEDGNIGVFSPIRTEDL